MARAFGSYSPAVPLGTTWEESIALEDENGDAINIADYDVRAQLREELALRDADTGNAAADAVLELTTPGHYATPPAWPVFEALSVPSPANGTILLKLDVDDLWTASPTNERRKLFWSIVLVNPDTGYVIPVLKGKVSFLVATTQ